MKLVRFHPEVEQELVEHEGWYGSAAKWQRKAFCSSWIMQSPQLPKRLNAGRPAGEANVGMFSSLSVHASLSRSWR
jgi:hypothetical protein